MLTREDLAGHIDDPLCSCYRCAPQLHRGIGCNCPFCCNLQIAHRGLPTIANPWPRMVTCLMVGEPHGLTAECVKWRNAW